jgi:hypothetical protein
MPDHSRRAEIDNLASNLLLVDLNHKPRKSMLDKILNGICDVSWDSFSNADLAGPDGRFQVRGTSEAVEVLGENCQ